MYYSYSIKAVKSGIFFLQKAIISAFSRKKLLAYLLHCQKKHYEQGYDMKIRLFLSYYFHFIGEICYSYNYFFIALDKILSEILVD